MQIRALTWNLFHGRDHPPEAALLTRRSRLLRTTERGATHLQVNRDLGEEFAATLRSAPWDVALLQECPPRWAASLAAACRAEGHRVLTGRNSFGQLRELAARANPDLIASNEGGSNLSLVRLDSARIVARRDLVLRQGPRPERRTMAFTRIELGSADGLEVCVVNLHASAGRTLAAEAEEEVLLAAQHAVDWARGAPLIVGGDLNLRPRDTELYAALRERHGLTGASDPNAIDQLLSRGLGAVDPPRPLPAHWREHRERGLAIRLSDHSPVAATFDVPASSQ